jgi:DNA polymerase III subunit gamma/tau
LGRIGALCTSLNLFKKFLYIKINKQMSLYLKYRPKTLQEVKGNKELIASLDGMLSNLETCPHSFLLTGPTGCGKTTIGRIIADRLGCKGTDFKEVDSADFRGIDTVREIRKQCNFKSLDGPCRVWLIDECHKMTNDAQNALLKILEDTPSHVYFILCTTDPQKLLPTIKGRCSSFQVNTLNETQMTGLLKRVARAEGQKLEAEVMERMVLDGEGFVRNTLQILDQVLRVAPEEQLAVAQRTALEESESKALCKALLEGKPWKAVSAILRGLKNQDPEAIRRHVLGYASTVLLGNREDTAPLIIEEFLEPTYNSGFAQIVYASYSVTKG